jgi:hypothetical protein
MFDLCLTSLKRGDNGWLWSSFVWYAQLLEKGNLFFIDIEGHRKIGVWEVSIITKGSQWTRLMNPLAGASTLNDSRKLCEERFGHPTIFRTAYEAFVGVPLPPGTNHTCALALDRLHEAVLKSKTHKELTPEILAATAGCDAGIHYAGDKNKWMLESVGYKGKMVNLHQMIQRFFHPLRHLVKDCYFSQANSCVVMGGEWRTAHRAENDALMAKDTFQGLVRLLHRHQVF